MKKITTLLIAALLGITGLKAQEPATLQELLDRLEQNHIGPITAVFSHADIERLQQHFYNSTTMSNAIPESGPRRYAAIENVGNTVSVIDPEDLSQIAPIGPTNVSEFLGAGVVRLNGQEVLTVDNGGGVHIRGINSNISTQVGTITGLAPDQSVTGLERRLDQIYALSTNGMGTTFLSLLNEFNDWEAIPRPNPTGQVVGIALGRDEDNNFYSYDIDTDLLSQIDFSTGEGTVVGSIGFDANFAQGMTFDPLENKLLMTAFNNSIFDSELREVNINTGFTTSLGTIVPGVAMQFGYSSYYNSTLSVNDPNLKSLLIYPVPTSRELTISAEQNLRSIEIVDVLGQLVRRVEVNEAVVRLDVSELSDGVYMARVHGQSGSFTIRKFIKN